MTCWETLLTLYSGIVLITTVTIICLWGCDKFILLDTPKELHDKTSMNWLGCIFVWLFEFLLNPIIWIVALVAEFLYWLFTVGRKD